jgi:hypothetical protein
MKRLLQTIILVLAVQTVFGQCQALFSAYYDQMDDSLMITDHSFNSDSTPMTGATYNYTMQAGAMNLSATTNNPRFFMNAYEGPVVVCLTINTLLGCSSTYCDTVNTTHSTCQAHFMYYETHNQLRVDFYNQSTVEYPGMPYTLSWTFTGGTPSTSDSDQPSVMFPSLGSYVVCLTIVSDSGCTDTYCDTISVTDSTQCNLIVTANITNATLTGGNDGAIDLNVSGGSPP